MTDRLPRPHAAGLVLVTPGDADVVAMLGSHHVDGVAITRKRERHLLALYRPALADTDGSMMDAARFRDATRRASIDGLRVVALLARFLEPGQDPVEYVEQLLIDAGADLMRSDWPGVGE